MKNIKAIAVRGGVILVMVPVVSGVLVTAVFASID